MDSLFLKNAFRRIVRRPATPVAIVATLTLSFAIAISMFAVLHGIVLKPLPYPDGERIVRLFSGNAESGVARSGLTGAEVIRGLPSVDAFAATGYSILLPAITALVDDVPRQINVSGVSAGFFTVFAIAPARGRLLIEADAADNRQIVVLNHKAWLDLGADPEIVGKRLRHLDGSVEIVGVLPEYFESSDTSYIYQPVRPSYVETFFGTRRSINVIARLAERVSLEAAGEQLNSRMQAVGEVQGTSDDGWEFRMVSLIDELVGNIRPTLFALMGIASVILVVSAATVTTLMSIRIGRRETDIAVERAVGSTPLSVFVATATELLLVVLVAIVAGWAAAFLAIRTISAWLDVGVLPRAHDIDVFSTPVVLAGIAAPVFIFLLALLPMRQMTVLEPATWLSRYSNLRWTSNWTKLLPVFSIALTTVSLATAVSLAVSSARMNEIDPGIVTDDVGALSLVRRQPPEQLDTFLRNSLDAIEAMPGVIDTSAILAGSPASPNFLRSTVEAQESGESVRTTIQFVSAGYHEFLGVSILAGRDIEETDTSGKPLVAVINETLSKILFRGSNAIGRTISLSGMDYEVVGIVTDRKNAGLRSPAEPELVMSIHQWLGPAATVLIKYDEMRPTWATEAVSAMRQVDPLQSISGFFTLEEALNANTRTMTFFTGTIWVFSALTFILALFGINAIVASAQSRSVRETGLRMAVGESRLRSALRVLQFGLSPAVIGAIIGTVAAVPVIGVFEDLLFLTGAGMKLSIAMLTGLVLVLSSVMAGTMPAYKASRTDLVGALRVE